MWKPIDLTGQRFGQLVVLRHVGFTKARNATWECKCDCGVVKVIAAGSLRNGTTVSCGCHRRVLLRTHGKTRTVIHNTWLNIIQRCTNPRNPNYKKYGARGVAVCDLWKNSFEQFYLDVGEPPTPKHSLDRYPNNDGNYEPGNVRWATDREQANNRRVTRFVVVGERTIPLALACEEFGVNYWTAMKRIQRGLSVDDLFGEKS